MWHATIHASKNTPTERVSAEADIVLALDGSQQQATNAAITEALCRWPESDGYERHFVREICFRSNE